MEQKSPRKSKSPWLWLVIGVVLALLLACLMPPITNDQKTNHTVDPVNSITAGSGKLVDSSTRVRKVETKETAEQIVARRLKQFSVIQRALVHKLAEHSKQVVPADVERFFDALDSGNWEEAKRIYHSLRDGLPGNSPRDDTLRPFWRAIVEAEQAHLWPAQQFLDYGNGILNSLRPGMVYVGGTDPGCFICTMMNATSDGEQHVTLTQNALADPSYLDYLRASGDGTLSIPTADQVQAAYKQYVDDLQTRIAHDEQFPDEPKQVLAGEFSTMKNGTVDITGPYGPVSIMAINNNIMQQMLQLNPDLSFALEQSGSMKSTYAGSAPLGPIFELRASDSPNAITPDAAGQVVNYWQNMAQNFQANGETSDAVLRSYAHDASSQGELLVNNSYAAQAAQAYQTALNIWPGNADHPNTEAITGLTGALAQQGQYDQANQALNTYLQNNPTQNETVNHLRASLTHH